MEPQSNQPSLPNVPPLSGPPPSHRTTYLVIFVSVLVVLTATIGGLVFTQMQSNSNAASQQAVTSTNPSPKPSIAAAVVSPTPLPTTYDNPFESITATPTPESNPFSTDYSNPFNNVQ